MINLETKSTNQSIVLSAEVNETETQRRLVQKCRLYENLVFHFLVVLRSVEKKLLS